jgi:hypothetical protein
VLAYVQQQTAPKHRSGLLKQQLRIATVRQLITEASASLEDDPFEALQLGSAAVRMDDDAETRASLVTNLISSLMPERLHVSRLTRWPNMTETFVAEYLPRLVSSVPGRRAFAASRSDPILGLSP